MPKMVMLKTFSIFTVRLAIFRKLIRPSPAGRTAPSMGLGFFPLCYRNERGEVFSTCGCSLVLSLCSFVSFFLGLVILIVETPCTFIVSQSAN